MIGHVLYVTVSRLIPLPGSTEFTNRYLCVASDEPGSGISSQATVHDFLHWQQLGKDFSLDVFLISGKVCRFG